MNTQTAIEPLLRRLAETPTEFLGEPKIGQIGGIHVAALVHDVLTGLGFDVETAFLEKFSADVHPSQRNAYKLVMITVWLLSDDAFAQMTPSDTASKDLLTETIPALAGQNGADKYVHDPERREELVRTTLAHLGWRPEGESETQAADRLTRISSTERKRLLLASRAAEARAREVREALARKAAQESADKWTRE